MRLFLWEFKSFSEKQLESDGRKYRTEKHSQMNLIDNRNNDDREKECDCRKIKSKKTV